MSVNVFNCVDQFYDSDEDVAWGPITLREIKRDLRSQAASKPKRRQTIGNFPEYSSGNTTSSSNYITANEDSLMDSEENKETDVDLQFSLISSSDDSRVISISSGEDVEEVKLDESHVVSSSSNHNFSLLENDLEEVYVEETQNSSANSSSIHNFLTSEDDVKKGNMEDSQISSGNSSLNHDSSSSEANENKVNIVDDILLKTPAKPSNDSDNYSAEELDNDVFESSHEISNGSNSLNDTLDDMEAFLNEKQAKTPMRNEVNESQSNNTEIKTPKPELDQFKMPSRLPVKKPFNVETDKFKHIVSPVRLYIKNSSLPVLKRSHTPKMSSSRLPLWEINLNVQQIPRKMHRDIADSFPEVFYEPSKIVLKKEENRIILPNNISKLIKEATVIKHEVRTQLNNFSDIGDFSIIGEFDDFDEPNVSVHVKKAHLNV